MSTILQLHNSGQYFHKKMFVYVEHTIQYISRMGLEFLIISILFDALLSVKSFWHFRVVSAFVAAVCSLIGVSILLYDRVDVVGGLILLVVIFRIIAYARIFHNQLHHNHLYSVTVRSFIFLDIALVSVFLLSSVPFTLATLEVLASLQLLTAFVLLGFIANSVHQTKYHPHEEYLSDKELPSITVAIPARNETDDLEACIESVLSSNYPKLEVIVLDDCSQGKKPAEIIKQHAHAGVRFLQGTQPPDDWLAKNYAYHQLTQEASGSYILFCGVDVRMSPSYLRILMNHMKLKKKRMISVLPLRLGSDIRSSFIQPMRYWWELALPRKFLNKPAVLSTCWVIDKKVLKRMGEFTAVKRSILPERYFARECVKHDTYSFIRADGELDIRTTKKPQSQIETAYRVRYPQFHNRLESILLYVLAIQVFLGLPYVLFIGSFVMAMPLVQMLSGLTILSLTIGHAIIVTISQPANASVALINLPFVALSEATISVYSMIKYEFSAVIWKGRNVCIPIMQQPKD